MVLTVNWVSRWWSYLKFSSSLVLRSRASLTVGLRSRVAELGASNACPPEIVTSGLHKMYVFGALSTENLILVLLFDLSKDGPSCSDCRPSNDKVFGKIHL